MAATLAERLIAKLEARRATGERAARADAPARAAAVVAGWGATHALIADDPWLDELGVPEELAGAGVEVRRWPPPGFPSPRRDGPGHATAGWRELLGLDGPAETVGVTVPSRGVAERGTLVLEADAAHGRAIDVVSARHLAILPAAHVVETLSEALAATYAPGRRPPSAVSLVSAPSRTSDIEKISTLGAHGALALHLLVVDET